MSKEPFAFIVKPVGSRCNMNCRYCYYLGKSEYSVHEKQSRMSYTILEKLIKQTIESSAGPVVSFTWHGGEPGLAGLEFYEKVVELEKKYLPKGYQVWNNLQTNGLLLNDKFCRFIKDNNFDVGLSIDGNESLHNANRIDKGGNGTYERVFNAARRMNKYGIRFDVLCTVNSANVNKPIETYTALKKLGSTWIQFIPIVIKLEDGFAKESITPEQYGNFLCTIFDEWTKKDLGSYDVQLFAETAKILNGDKPALCWMSKTCGRVLICEEDGAIYQCDHFVDNDHRLGYLLDTSLDSMIDSDRQISFGESKETALTDKCKNCHYLSMCGGGCLKDRFLKLDNEDNMQYYLCEGLRKYFDHSVPVLKEIMKMSSLGKNTKEIMSYLNK